MQSDGERKLSLAILAAVVLAQAVVLWPEAAAARVLNTDIVSHFTLVQGMSQAANPLDFWSPEVGFGFAVLRTYQPLAHLIVVAAWWALGRSVPLVTILGWCQYLAVLLLPVSVFVCVRKLGFPLLTAAASALLLPLVAGPGLGAFGLDLRSWFANGLYPQVVAVNLLLIALGVGFQAIRKSGRLASAGVLLGLTCAAHAIYGWMGALSLCLVAILPDSQSTLWQRIRRTAAIGMVALTVSAFQIWPLFTDGPLLNRGHFEPVEKYDSYGARTVLMWLFSGQLMDHDRLPILTLLAFGSAAFLLWRRRKVDLAAGEKFILAGAVFWVLVFFGRPTWGRLLLLVGATRDLHLHRVIGAAQLFLLLLAGLALAALWRTAASRWKAWSAVAITALLLLPMAVERIGFLLPHLQVDLMSAQAVDLEQDDLDNAIKLVKQRGGRAYAGTPQNWGLQFKVGDAPFYSFLSREQVPAVSFQYNSSSLPSDFMPTFDESNPNQYRLFNIRSVVAPSGQSVPGFVSPLATFGRFTVYDAPGAGYFDVVDAVERTPANRDTFFDICQSWLHSDAFDRSRYLLLDFFGDAPPLPALPDSPSNPGVVVSEHQSGQTYEANFDAARPAFVLFRMTWHPRWKTYVDGHPAKTVMLSPGFLGVPIAPGHHHIRCAYEPGNLKMLMAIAGLLIGGVLMGLEWRRAA